MTIYTDSKDEILNFLYLKGIDKLEDADNYIKVYFEEDKRQVLNEINDELINKFVLNESQITIEEFTDHNWNEEWKESIEPVNINDKIIITPSWKADSITNQKATIITIDPKMSFGTGHNDTTQMILEMMYNNISKEDKTMIDYGCGTGILSIAGAKLGIEKISAIDIDDDAVRDANENIELNCVNDNVKIIQSNIDSVFGSFFDVITANINYEIISKNMKYIKSRLKPGGKLFITGILTEEKEKMMNSLTAYNILIKELKQSPEWIAIYAVNK